MLRKLLAITAVTTLAACSTSPTPTPVLQTPQGPVQGVVTKNGIHNYKGIPFAAPPVGDLRWRPPVKAQSWTETKMANEFSPMCMQPSDSGNSFISLMVERHGMSAVKRFIINRAVELMGEAEMSEDCLYLNVRTPNPASGGSEPVEPLPVMVWIHGGGHQFGSSDFDFYQGDDLPQKGVVLVTINYRLGAFGYMAHPALSEDDPRGVSGNYGTLDQVAALEWVRDNISAYGGDPANVTIFGESAGAWSVTEMMTTPSAKGLFHRGIGQSGASTYHLGQMDGKPTPWISGYEGGLEVEKRLGLKNSDAEALRGVPADEIISIVTDELADAFHHVRDGVVFPKNVGIAFQDGDFHPVPTLFGYNSDEATVFFPNGPEPSVWFKGMPQTGRDKQIEALSPHFGAKSEQLVDLYGLDKDYDFGGEQMMGDELFGVNIRMVTRTNAAAGNPAYAYVFTRVPPNKKQTIGAYHSAEIPFVFGTPEKAFGWSDEDEHLAELMQNYWVNFAKSGNPNGPGLPNWPEYADGNWMQLSGNDDLSTTVVRDYRKDKLDALETGLQGKLSLLRRGKTPETSGSDQPSNE